jgi:hypothetical protein
VLFASVTSRPGPTESKAATKAASAALAALRITKSNGTDMFTVYVGAHVTKGGIKDKTTNTRSERLYYSQGSLHWSLTYDSTKPPFMEITHDNAWTGPQGVDLITEVDNVPALIDAAWPYATFQEPKP